MKSLGNEFIVKSTGSSISFFLDECPMRILSFVLMPNHWHFVLRPQGDDDLTKFCRWLTPERAASKTGCRSLAAGRRRADDGRRRAFCGPVVSGELGTVLGLLDGIVPGLNSFVTEVIPPCASRVGSALAARNDEAGIQRERPARPQRAGSPLPISARRSRTHPMSRRRPLLDLRVVIGSQAP
jgi:hypothetical protein